MTTFIRLLGVTDKEGALLEAVNGSRENLFEIDPLEFRNIKNSPFAYWAGESILRLFKVNPAFETADRHSRVGMSTSDDYRFIRLWWENCVGSDVRGRKRWAPFAKGGAYASFYSDIYLEVLWGSNGAEIKAWVVANPTDPKTTHWSRRVANSDYFGRPGLTWSLRSQRGLSFRALPRNCLFGHKGPSTFSSGDQSKSLLALLSISNSQAFEYLVSLQMAFGSYEVGVIQRTPLPRIESSNAESLARYGRRAWCLARAIDTTDETSHAFVLPGALRARQEDYDLPSVQAELEKIQAEIDDIVFDLYGFSPADRAAALGSSGSTDENASDAAEDADDSEDDDGADAVDQTDGLLSWAAGVAFGRFDWRLATGEREAPSEPEPFDPLPAKSPGMLPDDAEPFYAHSGILLDDQGHPNDLARLIEEVLARVDAPVPAGVRRWLQRDLFPLHLKQYSKSRRKAPIYWPISTSSGSYTLWLYYPSLTDQTLFTAVNDFIEPKLSQVGQDVAALRTKGSARSRDEERNFEALQALELELIELRDTLLEIAQTYCPNHDDGVQITAAPLWHLFRHKPWQKVLKDTWAKLEKGDYDWVHLAMAYWPDRVREKCKTDKSLAIAHDLEHLYVESEPKPTQARGRKRASE